MDKPCFAPEARRLLRRDGRGLIFNFRACGLGDLEAIHALEAAVYGAMEDKRFYGAPESRESLEEMLRGELVIGAFAGSRLVGCAMLVANRESPAHMAYKLGFPPERLPRAVTYNAIFVDGQYRGFGLQRELLGMMDRAALGAGADCALASVSPHNEASLKNLLSAGFGRLEERPLYGGLWRLILIKSLSPGNTGEKQEG